MIKKINSLTKVFIKSFYQNSKVFNNKYKRIEKKSMFFWSIIIIAIAVFFVSYKIIDILIKVGQPGIFLNIYFLILFIILAFQTILISTNIYFFSKDLEYILPMPIKPIELFFAKFNTLLSITYTTEILFGIIPLAMYGLMAHMSISFFILMPIVLIIFPVLIVAATSIITLTLMNLARIIKNVSFLQIFITVFLMVIMLYIQWSITNRIANITNYANEIESTGEVNDEIIGKKYAEITDDFIIINPSIQILDKKSSSVKILYNIVILIMYNIISMSILLVLGKKNYIENILKTFTGIRKNLGKKIIISNKKNKSIWWEYVKIELKKLFRHPIFLIQTILPVIILIISIVNILIFIIFIINGEMKNGSSIKTVFDNMTFDFEMSFIILCILQIIFSISGVSLTAISRDGRDAIFMKYIPINLYEQFILKNVIQVVLNFIVSIFILGVSYYLMPFIGLNNILIMLIISIFINIINSYITLVIDIKRPNLNWDSEYIVVKKNPNRIFQYALTIIMILFLMYMSKVCRSMGVNINIGLIIEGIIFFTILIIIDKVIRKNINKLFDKIV